MVSPLIYSPEKKRSFSYLKFPLGIIRGKTFSLQKSRFVIRFLSAISFRQCIKVFLFHGYNNVINANNARENIAFLHSTHYRYA